MVARVTMIRSKINPRQRVLLEFHLRRQIPEGICSRIAESAYASLKIRSEHGNYLVAIAHQCHSSGGADIDFRASRAQRRFSGLEFNHHTFISPPHTLHALTR